MFFSANTTPMKLLEICLMAFGDIADSKPPIAVLLPVARCANKDLVTSMSQ